MREGFGGFYGNSEETIELVLKSDKTIFIFDTNIFLTLYRCEEETRNQFFEIWKKVKDKCWFPHHVCLEYQRNRLSVIKGSRDSLNAIPNKIKNTINDLKKEIYGNTHSQTISRYSKLRNEIDNLFEKIDNNINSFISDSIDVRNEKIDFFNSHDVIRDEIDSLTEGKIGPAPASQKIIEALNKEGKIRYQYKMGPGYEDSTDKKNNFYAFNGIRYDAEYGDYYVWSQILDYAQSSDEINIVYVTNDAKSDFFYKLDGKIRGPNESLTSEIKNRGVKEFILQNLDTFLHHAKTHLNVQIEQETITELSNASSISQVLTSNKDDNSLTNSSDSTHLENQLHTKYLLIQNAILKRQEELTALNMYNNKTANNSSFSELEKKKNRLNQELQMYYGFLRELASDISRLQEKNALEQLINENKQH
ncbi:DUF4935 domain-containing protein [Klebsiella oxytoca]